MSEVITNWVLFDATADKPYIKKMMSEGFLAFFDSEEDAKRAKASNKGTDYKRIDRVKASDYDQLKEKLWHSEMAAEAEAHLADELKAERDALRKKLDEARELLEECSDMADACEDQVLLGHIDAWLEANKV